MLADDLGEGVGCIAIGPAEEAAITELADYGADSVFFFDSPMPAASGGDSAAIYLEALATFIWSARPRKLLCTDSLADRDLACRLAARVGSALITGCVDLLLNEDGLIACDKPVYLGRLISTFACPDTSLEIVSVKAGSCTIAPCKVKKSPQIRIIEPEPNSAESPLKTIDIVKADPAQIGLDEAGIIVTGGRGMESAANFKLLYQLAGLLGGTVAGSLGAVDEGWVPRSRLVGQTGTTVAPKLYIACGVSGSIYHLMGMRDSKSIIAINKDRFAPIFKYADLGIVGDAMTVIPLIIDELKNESHNHVRKQDGDGRII